MTVPSHHPGDTFLLDYAGGALCEASSLIVATHLALCPGCRLTVAEMEAIGGAMLEEIEPEELSCGCLEAVMARLDAAPPRPRAAMPARPARSSCCQADVPLLPEPLRRHVGGDLERLPWKTLMPGISAVDLPTSGRARVHLMRMKGGASAPAHTHDGLELVLVLAGGFSDEFGQFARGDLAVGDDSVEHRPVAAPEGCLCLAVTDGALRFTGPIGRLLNPFVKF